MAAELGVNRSMARRFPVFTALDWERPISSLVTLFCADPDTIPDHAHLPPTDMLRLPLLELSRIPCDRRSEELLRQHALVLKVACRDHRAIIPSNKTRIVGRPSNAGV